MKDHLGGSFLFASIIFPERFLSPPPPKSLTIFNTTKKTWGRNIPFPAAGSHLLDLFKSMTDMCTLPEKKITTCEVPSEYLEIVTTMRTWSDGEKGFSFLL